MRLDPNIDVDTGRTRCVTTQKSPNDARHANACRDARWPSTVSGALAEGVTDTELAALEDQDAEHSTGASGQPSPGRCAHAC